MLSSTWISVTNLFAKSMITTASPFFSEIPQNVVKNLKLQPVRAKSDVKDDVVPQEVLESTMEVENGYFERFIAKRE